MWHDCGSCVSFGGRREGDRASQQVLPMIPQRPVLVGSFLNPLTVKHRPLVLVSGSHSTAELDSFDLFCVFWTIYPHFPLKPLESQESQDRVFSLDRRTIPSGVSRGGLGRNCLSPSPKNFKTVEL